VTKGWPGIAIDGENQLGRVGEREVYMREQGAPEKVTSRHRLIVEAVPYGYYGLVDTAPRPLENTDPLDDPAREHPG
jgi:hypothetical protein